MIALTKILLTLPPLLSILLKITIILGLGWTLHFLLARRNPRWRVLLWRGVVAGVVLVPILVPLKYLQVPVTLPPEPAEQTETTQPLVQAELPEFETFDSSSKIINTSPLPSVPDSQPQSPASPDSSFSISTWASKNLYPVIFSLWGLIAVLITARFLAVLVKIRKKVKSALPTPKHLQHLLDEVADNLNCSQKITLRYSHEFTSPFLAGLTRPVIILPKKMVAAEHIDELPAILAHEVAHLRSQDLLWMFATRWLSVVLWFHPLIWKLRDAHSTACEEVCDAVAADYVGNAESYSSTLARIALAIVGRVPAVAGIPMARSSEIIGRLRILKRKVYSSAPARRWVVLSLLVGCIVLAILGGLSLVYTEDSAGGKAARLQVRKYHSLPPGCQLNYDDGIREHGVRTWVDGMARNLLELRAMPSPANEYDESWKQERLEFEILSQKSQRVGSIIIWGDSGGDRIILVPNHYKLLYTRQYERDPVSSCFLHSERAEFPVDLSRPGMYELKFRPNLKTSKTFGPGEYPPATYMGTVIDSQGNPLDEAAVAAYEMFCNAAGGFKSRLIGEAHTKADGRFSFEAVPSVKKTRSMGGIVVADKQGLATGWTNWPLYGTQQTKIVLGKASKLEGVVMDEKSVPVADADIRAVLFKEKTSETDEFPWLPGIAPMQCLAAKTDSSGRFLLSNIPPNVRADLLITAQGLATTYTRRPDSKGGYEGAAFAAGRTDIKVVLQAEGRIEGRIINEETGEGIPATKLAVVPTFSPTFFERFVCISGQDGGFSVGGLQNGKYLVRLPRAQRKLPRGVLPQKWASGFSITVTVESGKTVRDVILKVPPELIKNHNNDSSEPSEPLKGKGERPNDLAGKPGTRVIQFPKDRSMGVVYLGQLRTTDSLWWQGWEEIGEAKGDVAVPADKDVRLTINSNGLENLSFLEALGLAFFPRFRQQQKITIAPAPASQHRRA